MSDSEGTRTLYANSDQSRFFWIPDDHECEQGTLLIRSLTGSRLEVTEAEAAKWEVDEAQAKDLAKLQVQRYTKAAGSFLSAGAAVFRQVAQKQREGKIGGLDSVKAKPDAAGLAEALGTTPEELVNDPGKALEGLKETLKGIGDTLKKQASENPADKEEVKARMEILARAIGEATGDPASVKNLEDVPRVVNDFLSNPELAGKVRKMTEELKQTAAEIRNATNVKEGE